MMDNNAHALFQPNTALNNKLNFAKVVILFESIIHLGTCMESVIAFELCHEVFAFVLNLCQKSTLPAYTTAWPSNRISVYSS